MMQNKENRLYTQAEFLALLNRQEKERQMATQEKALTLLFGKHQGKVIDEKDDEGNFTVPTDYLQWIVDNFKPGKIRTACKEELLTRDQLADESDDQPDDPPF